MEQAQSGVEVLRDLNRRGVRRVPDDAPVEVRAAQLAPVRPQPGRHDRPSITGSCACSQSFAEALHAGEVWVQGSRRYTRPRALPDHPQQLAGRQIRDLAELELASVRQATPQARANRAPSRRAGSRPAGDDIATGEHGNLNVKRLRAQPRDPDVQRYLRALFEREQPGR
jgi:hypothetical protein